MDKNKKIRIDDLEDVSGGLFGMQDPKLRGIKPGAKTYSLVNGEMKQGSPATIAKIDITNCETKFINNKTYYKIGGNEYICESDVTRPSSVAFL